MVFSRLARTVSRRVVSPTGFCMNPRLCSGCLVLASREHTADFHVSSFICARRRTNKSDSNELPATHVKCSYILICVQATERIERIDINSLGSSAVTYPPLCYSTNLSNSYGECGYHRFDMQPTLPRSTNRFLTTS